MKLKKKKKQGKRTYKLFTSNDEPHIDRSENRRRISKIDELLTIDNGWMN